MYMKPLAGRIAIVTGASRTAKASLGVSFARALAGAGASVVVAANADCAPVAAEIEAAGGVAMSARVDVQNERSVQDMVGSVLARFGRVDILVNNAAIGSNIAPVAIEDLDAAQWDELMAVNVRGPFLVSKAVIPAMKKAGYGKIINIGSTTMIVGLPNRLHYTTAKGAIQAMTRSMARELGPSGIRVNTLAFGLISSDVNRAHFADNPGARQAMLAARSVPEDLVNPDLDGTIVFLASSASDAMTGQYIVADKGAIFT
jgi:NAD(P)-dependent dehydrogenase (short-subunit alcohol dehydrogenase family)